jgi:rSAM/selenodomain-associated transferase 1
MSKKFILIIFAKIPREGYVKSRLAEKIGTRASLDIYIQLLERTLQVAKRTIYRFRKEKQSFEIHWFWSGRETDPTLSEMASTKMKEFRAGLENQWFVLDQDPGNLGEKMGKAFQKIFGRQKDASGVSVCIIGSDCPELDTELIREAYWKLESQDLVIGPALDGGYYLLGMNQFHPELFQKIDWSTSKVREQTREKADRLGLKYVQVRELRDLDSDRDLLYFREKGIL